MKYHTVEVRLSAASAETVCVGYWVTGGTAYGREGAHGSGEDYDLSPGVLVFLPGEISKTIQIGIVDDSTIEADETIDLVLGDPVGAVSGAVSKHTVTILDDDHANLLSVTDFGAKGDGETDDTSAIQQAVDSIFKNGGGVLLFPHGVYLVTSIMLRDGITYQGNGATLRRPPKQGKWVRTFTSNYAGDEDSKPLIVKGLSFDGNSQEQGAYDKYELEQAHLLFLHGDPKRSGRLKAVVEDCVFWNSVADGISVHTNVDVTIYRNEAIDIFRAGIGVTGGHTVLRVHGFTGREGRLGQGAPFRVEVDGRGYNDDFAVWCVVEDVALTGGNLAIGLQSGSTFEGSNITAGPPINFYSVGATVHLKNSRLWFGLADTYSNRIVCPGNLLIEDSDITVTRKLTSRTGNRFALADIFWSSGSCRGADRDQSVVFRNVQFRADGNFQSGDKVFLIAATQDVRENRNTVTMKGGSIGTGFKDGLSMNQGGTWCFDDVALVEPLRFAFGGTTTTLLGSNNRLNTAIVDGVVTENGCQQKPLARPAEIKVPIEPRP